MSSVFSSEDIDELTRRLVDSLPKKARETYKNRIVPKKRKRDGWYAARQHCLLDIRERRVNHRDQAGRARRYEERSGISLTKEDEAATKEHEAAAAKLLEQEHALRAETLPPDLPLETLDEFLRRNKHQRFDDAPSIEIKLAKGVSLQTALQNSRERLSDIRRESGKVSYALLPMELTFAKAVADFDAAAKVRGPDLSRVCRLESILTGRDGPVRQGTLQLPVIKMETGASLIDVFDAAGFMSWLFRDAIIARLRSDLEAMYDGAFVLSAEGRAKRLAELESEYLIEERREEQLVRLCEDAGIDVQRRPLANPLAVLAIVPRTAPRVDASSPKRAVE